MVKIGTTPISNLAVGNKNIDLLNIGNNVVYAGYSYPCVGEYNFNPNYYRLLFNNILICLMLETLKIIQVTYTFQNI